MTDVRVVDGRDGLWSSVTALGVGLAWGLDCGVYGLVSHSIARSWVGQSVCHADEIGIREFIAQFVRESCTDQTSSSLNNSSSCSCLPSCMPYGVVSPSARNSMAHAQTDEPGV